MEHQHYCELCGGKTKHDHESLVRMFMEEDKTVSMISEETGISQSYIGEILRRHGINPTKEWVKMSYIGNKNTATRRIPISAKLLEEAGVDPHKELKCKITALKNGELSLKVKEV